jgi:hypothetical protein
MSGAADGHHKTRARATGFDPQNVADVMLSALPAPFTEYVQEKLAELDDLEVAQHPAWSHGSRRLFAVLTQTLGPISDAAIARRIIAADAGKFPDGTTPALPQFHHYELRSRPAR